jgi:hypothetical protein
VRTGLCGSWSESVLALSGAGSAPLLPDTQNEHAATPCVRTKRPLFVGHSPTVLTGVKGLRFAPVLVDGLRPPLTPSALRRNRPPVERWTSPPFVTLR